MEIDTLSVILLILIIFFTFLSINDAPSPDVHPLLLTSQSECTKVRNPGETAIYRANNSAHGLPLLTSPDKSIKIIADLFENGKKLGIECLGFKGANGFEWDSYQKIAERVANFGSGMIKSTGLAPKSLNMFGIFMNSCPEWVIADLVSSYYSLITVSIPNIPPRLNDVINQINLTQIGVVVVSKDTLPMIFSAAQSCASLKHVILNEPSISPDQSEKAKAIGLTLTTFKDIEELGTRSKLDFVFAEPEDTATIVFTSGTTSGEPSGIELTQANLVADVAGLLSTLPNSQKVTPADRHLSYLPLAHMLERITVIALLYSGASIAFYSGNLSTVLKEAEEIKPTIFTSSPRFLIRFHETMIQTFGNEMFFEKGYASKLNHLRKGKLVTNSIWDMLIFNKIKAKFGGKVRVIVTGSGPISQTALNFLRITVGCQVIQAYGLTQCSGAVTVNAFFDYQPADRNGHESHTGGPIPCNEIKLVNYEEKGYTVEDKPNPRGEICVRGPNVMKGYYKRPEQTAQAIDADGWLRTGDIGTILPNGTLKIIDRKLPIKRQ
ncbi:4246_t:CDS:10 [Funneliformis mosseae]|uniref:4246_t:CDS:1 n=1 Tax=Funneliformis mosseae TaxID=27381 RepID=A0A9N8YL10_FUNMO|nr:4246_t:CDS:10 [Funneliformis mosseae]